MFFVSLMFIILSVVGYCVQTIEQVSNDHSATLAMKVLEGICGIWFTIEFALRLATCPSKQDFVKQISNWIDFIAIWPFYIHILTSKNLVYEILAICRLLRLSRFFKVNLGFQILKQTMIASSRELLLLGLLIIVPVIIFASIAYLVEKELNKEFASIPGSFWWAIITITTVGYGDAAPVTLPGKLCGALCAVLSILITALPISVIGSNFSLYYSHAQAQMKLPKKSKRPIIGAANALMMIQSSRPSEDMNSTDIAEERQEAGAASLAVNGSLEEDCKVHPYRGR